MEKLNLNFSDSFNIVKSVLWILSIISWLFFLCTGWASLYYMSYNNNKYYNIIDNYNIVWTIKILSNKIQNLNYNYYYPLQINITLMYIIISITMLFGLVGFILYIIKSTWKKQEAIFEGMMGIWTRLHSFPLIIVSFLFLLGEYFYPNNIKKKENNLISYKEFFNNERDICIIGLAFCLLALISLIFIYIATNIKTGDWYVTITTKKGTYSCLIVLLWYYFIYSIYQINDYNDLGMKPHKRQLWNKWYSTIFSILFGAGCLTFSFFFKDIIVSFMNCLVYLGMIIYFFSVGLYDREFDNNKYGDGIIDIIMLVLSAGMIAFLVIKYRKECLEIPQD
jgi:hypothetical protein